MLGGNEGGLQKITLLNRSVRHGQTMNGWPFLAWEADPRHKEIITETLGLRRAQATKTLSSLGIKRSMDEVNNSTNSSEDHAITHRSVCMRINYLAQYRPDILVAAKEMARWQLTQSR